MTTHPTVLEVSALVEMSAPGGRFPDVRIDDIQGDQVVVALPDGAGVPALGDAVSLRWPAGYRGRWVQTGTVVGLHAGNRTAVDVDGEPRIEQNREYVRGGGGEQAWLVMAASEIPGRVQDISERGIRVRFGEDAPLAPGRRAQLRVELGDETISLVGEVLKTNVLHDSGPRQSTQVEAVVVFDADEARAQTIRRYVLQQQLQARARLADA